MYEALDVLTSSMCRCAMPLAKVIPRSGVSITGDCSHALWFGTRLRYRYSTMNPSLSLTHFFFFVVVCREPGRYVHIDMNEMSSGSPETPLPHVIPA